jgi:leader peptidase (prepilin peptidase) / N-methyltransferase
LELLCFRQGLFCFYSLSSYNDIKREMAIFYIYIFIFVFGLIIGSFLNCLIYRLAFPNFSLKNLRGRSFCFHCKHLLGWQDLIPVLSFLFLKGNCRYCRKPISWQYPLVEISTAIIFLLIYNLEFAIFQFPTIIYYWTISSFLIVIFVYDLKHYIIPDKMIYPAIILAGVYNLQSAIVNEFSILKFSVLSAIGAAGFFLFIVWVSRRKWMGAGDIKLAFLMGLFLGWPNILIALLLAFYIGAIIGLGLILFGLKNLKSEIPFAPFLITGTFLALFWGSELINWYQILFLFY